jgi:TPR repeat protein
MWAYSSAWEKAASNFDDLLSEEPEEWRSLFESSQHIADSDPASAFRLNVEAAAAGLVCSMETAGWHYWTGTGVIADKSLALDYYHRAVLGGSWLATIGYARLLAEAGRHDDCERVLNDGIAAGFAPAYFWLAWLRYEQSRTSDVCRKVRPLLETAARMGHPAAKEFLASWMANGKLGLLEIPRGCVLLWRQIREIVDQYE